MVTEERIDATRPTLRTKAGGKDFSADMEMVNLYLPRQTIKYLKRKGGGHRGAIARAIQLLAEQEMGVVAVEPEGDTSAA